MFVCSRLSFDLVSMRCVVGPFLNACDYSCFPRAECFRRLSGVPFFSVFMYSHGSML